VSEVVEPLYIFSPLEAKQIASVYLKLWMFDIESCSTFHKLLLVSKIISVWNEFNKLYKVKKRCSLSQNA
jgi:hypothetical protein